MYESIQILAIDMAQYEYLHGYLLSYGQRIVSLRTPFGWIPKSLVIELMKNGINFYVQRPNYPRADLRIVSAFPPYVETYPDNTTANNLLSLPGGPFYIPDYTVPAYGIGFAAGGLLGTGIASGGLLGRVGQ